MKMFSGFGRLGAAVTLAAIVIGAQAAPAQIDVLPKADKKGAKDSPLLKRYEGSLIIAYFDFIKADVKAESETTLAEIAKLLKSSSKMNLLVVGHTDSVGSFDFNLDLSQKRAAAVVDALTGRFGVSRGRLKPFGVSFASPAASNQSEEGRAKNRRVELVDNATAPAPSSGETALRWTHTGDPTPMKKIVLTSVLLVARRW